MLYKAVTMADDYENNTRIIVSLGDLNSTVSATNVTMRFDWVQQFISNRAISQSALIGLLVSYVVLIITGATGNGLVCLAVARKPQMRTARNVFIINLAISDLILCLFTMPFSLIEIVLKLWPLGILTCKLVGGLQATSIFVSTISITAIALDRYKVIIYPTQENCKPLNAVITLTCIWIIALVLASPLFWFRTVEHVYIGLPWLQSVTYCLERWPLTHGGGYYAIFTMLFQYVLPIVIVSAAYARICRKLKYRMITKGTKLQEKQERDKKRVKKTNVLLISIAFIFGVSWLPLNILNIMTDFYFPFEDSVFRIVFACCHMAGMSSACSNPLLYGWLNDNFRKEFREIFNSCCSCFLINKKSPAVDRGESVMIYGKSQQQNTTTCSNQQEKFETIVVSVSK